MSMTNKRKTSRKLLRREMVQKIADEFRRLLPPQPTGPKRVVRVQRNTVPHYELAQAAIKEFIDIVNETLSDNRPVVLRRFGALVPRPYKPLSGVFPGASPGDKKARYSIPVRMGVQFLPSARLKKAIRDRDAKHGFPSHLTPGNEAQDNT